MLEACTTTRARRKTHLYLHLLVTPPPPEPTDAEAFSFSPALASSGAASRSCRINNPPCSFARVTPLPSSSATREEPDHCSAVRLYGILYWEPIPSSLGTTRNDTKETTIIHDITVTILCHDSLPPCHCDSGGIGDSRGSGAGKICNQKHYRIEWSYHTAINALFIWLPSNGPHA